MDLFIRNVNTKPLPVEPDISLTLSRGIRVFIFSIRGFDF